MKILNVTGSNFLSYRTFTLNLADRGVVLVEGDNGSGKSAALADALCWAWYGKTVRGISGDAVAHDPLHSGKAKDCFVCVQHVGDDGRKYEIVRFRGLKRKNGVIVAVYNDDDAAATDISGATAKETDALIESIIGIPFDVFVNSVVFGQGMVRRFTAATDSERKAMLDKLLGMERFAEARDRTRAKLADNKLDLDDANQDANTATVLIEDIKGQLVDDHADRDEWLALTTKKIKKLKRSVSDMEAVCRGGFKEQRAEQSTHEEAQAVLQEHQERRSDLDEVVQSKRLRLDVTMDDLRRLSDKREKARSVMNRDDRNMENAEIACAARKERREAIDVEREAHDLVRAELSSATCEACARPLTKAQRVVAEDKLVQLDLDLDEATADADEAVTETAARFTAMHDVRESSCRAYETLTTEYNDAKIAHDDATTAVRTATEARDAVRQSDAYLEAMSFEARWAMSTKARAAAARQIEQAKEDLGIARGKLAAAEEEWTQDIRADSIEKLETHLKRREDEFADAAARIDTLGLVKSDLQFWYEAFGPTGLRSLLLDNVLPALNGHANRYAAALSNGKMSVSFDTETTLKSGKIKDKFDVLVKVENGASCYEQASGGQQRRADIAVLLALRALVAERGRSSFDLLVLDEPFENLDAAGVEAVVDLLCNDVAADGAIGSVFLITHSPDMKALFPNRMSVRRDKKHGISTIS